MKCSCFLIYFLLHHPYMGMLQRLRSIGDGAAWPHPWVLPGFLESLFRDLSCLEMNCGVCQMRLQLSQPTEQGFAGMVGGQGSLGTHGRSRQCSNSSAEPHFQLHLAQEHKHSLMDWRQNGNHGSCPSFWMGNIPCFLGKGAKPCSRDSGLWENGGRGVPGTCAGNCERGEESPFCL